MKQQKFAALWKDYEKLAGAPTRKGLFAYSQQEEQALGEKMAEAKVSPGYGVYAIYGLRDRKKELIYVGKSGTVRQDGSLQKQGLSGRIGNKGKGLGRPTIYKVLVDHADVTEADKNAVLMEYPFIKDSSYDTLEFRWIETYKDGKGVPPAVAEANLLWAHLNEFGKLPKMNSKL